MDLHTARPGTARNTPTAFKMSLILALMLGISACSAAPQLTPTLVTAAAATQAPAPSATAQPSATLAPTPQPTALPSLTPTRTITPTATAAPTLTPVPVPFEVISDVNAAKIKPMLMLKSEPEQVPFQMAFSRDGGTLTIVSRVYNPFAPASAGVTVRIHNAATGEILKELKIPSQGLLHPDGLHFIGYDEKKLYVYDLTSGKVTSEQVVSSGKLTLGPDGNFLVIEHYPQPPEIWDLQKGASAFKPAEVKSVNNLGFSQDGSSLAMLYFNGVYVYNLKTGALTGKFEASAPLPYDQIYMGDIALSPDGSYVAIDCSYDFVQAFQLWDVRSGKLVNQWSSAAVKPDSQDQIGFSPDGKWAALATQNTTLLFNGKTGALVKTFNGGWPAAFSSDSRYLSAATAQGDIYLYNLEKGTLLVNLRGHSHRPDTILFQPGGKLLASLQYTINPVDGLVGFWGIPAAGTVIARAGISVQQGVSSIADGVPEAWLVKAGKAARYQVQISLENATLTSCPYSGNHTLLLKQQIENVVVIDLETNAVIGQSKFYGKKSVFWSGCPQDRKFTAQTEEVYITEPDIEGFGAWLEALMKPFGFTR